MNELTNDLNDAISKNLPSQVADELQKRLSDLEGKELQLKEALNLLDDATENLDITKQSYEELLEKYSENVKRESDLAEQEISIRNRSEMLSRQGEILLLREQHAKEKCDLMFELFKIPFSNKKVKEEIFSQIVVPNENICQSYNSPTGVPSEFVCRDDNVRDSHTTKTTEDT